MARTRPAKPVRRRLAPTAHQTVGPFFPAQFIPADANDLAGLSAGRARAEGQPCMIFGTVRDAFDKPAVNVILEIWQANAAGRFNHPRDRGPAPLDPNFSGWGRTWTDRAGGYHFFTIKPGGYRAGARSNRWFAPRIGLTLVGSGLMRPLVTAIYFPDEPLNDEDPQLEAIGSAARRQLIAVLDDAPNDAHHVPAFRFDIRLGGKQATPFLED
jgi:protocatechuate 3,4-dioxygenase beta subunit